MHHIRCAGPLILVKGFIILYDCIGRVYTLTVLLNFVFFHEWRKSALAKQRYPPRNNNQWRPRTWSRPFTRSSMSTMPICSLLNFWVVARDMLTFPPPNQSSVFGVPSEAEARISRSEAEQGKSGSAASKTNLFALPSALIMSCFQEVYKKPIPGPPFSMDAIFKNSAEEL